jgi:CubicO group peptidase (beta-lactamase class C family)
VDRLSRISIAVHESPSGGFVAEIGAQRGTERVPIWRDGSRLRFQSTDFPIAFDGTFGDDSVRLGGFVHYGSTIARVQLERDADSTPVTWVRHWSPLDVTEKMVRLDLYIGDDGAGGIGGYFFFRDQRLPALWGYGLACSDAGVELGEKNLGLRFEGVLTGQDSLAMAVSGVAGTAAITFARMPEHRVPAFPNASERPPRPVETSVYVEHAPAPLDDGWSTAKPSDVGIDASIIREMIRVIVDEELALTHSVLIARQGRLVVEEYFYGFDRATWHDMRSASKTVASTLVGLAVQEGRIEDVDATALSFFPKYRYYANWDPRKARITVQDLLTMSSGLDANDSDPQSPAAEGAYQSQTSQPDWIKLVLDAPMIADPAAQPLYGSGNPLILGGILHETVGEPLEWFAHRTLFGPLGIEHYKFVVDPTGVIYMGGGMHMRPRDMAKYGQLYLDGGVWNGRRILSEAWVQQSWGRYGKLAPLNRNGHDYGYLWWHHQYEVGGRLIETVEARGNGGQYVFVVPSLDLVAVITSGNFRTGKTRQPEEILLRFVLPAVLQ